jgi:hypothetical protein
VHKIFPQGTKETEIMWGISHLLDGMKIGKDASFSIIVLSDPTNVVYRLCSLLTSWEILQTNQDRRKVENGAG